MADAMRAIARTSSRRVILDHLRIIVIGARYARVGTGLDDLLDFAGRHSEIRLTPRLLMAEGEAAPLLSTEPPLEAEAPESLTKKLEAKGGLNPMLKEVLIATIAPTESPWIYSARVQLSTLKGRGQAKEGVQLNGIALIKGRKLVDILPIPETRAFALLMQHPEDSELSIPCSGEESKRFSVRLEKGGAKIMPSLSGQQPTFHVNAKVTAVLINSECRHSNITIPANRKRFEQAVQAQLSSDMEALVKRVQRVAADPVAFGKRLQLRYPAYFRQNERQWGQIWAKSPVTFALKVSLRHSNLLLDPVNKTRFELRQEG